ncbi:MAG: hypothetical protein WAU01_15530, partial [Saprospiraceae bacterium]
VLDRSYKLRPSVLDRSYKLRPSVLDRSYKLRPSVFLYSIRDQDHQNSGNARPQKIRIFQLPLASASGQNVFYPLALAKK